MKDILPIPMQCKKRNESVSSYAFNAGVGTNYKLISIFKYLLDFTSLQVINNFKYMKMNIFQLEYRSTLCIFQAGIMVLCKVIICNLV